MLLRFGNVPTVIAIASTLCERDQPISPKVGEDDGEDCEVYLFHPVYNKNRSHSL
jgi:hypothetical protein